MSTPIKHIHVVAHDDDQAGLDKTGLTLILLSYEADGSNVSEEYKNFTLPDEENRLKRFVDDVYGSGNPPSNVAKIDFRDKVVEYSLNIATKRVDYNKLNEYYYNVTSTEESQQQIAELFSQKAFSKLKEENALGAAKKEENLTVFESSTASNSEINQSFTLSETSSQDEESVGTPEEQLAKKQKELFGDKPSEGNQRPVQNLWGMSVEDAKVFANLPFLSTVKFKGVGGARLIEPVPEPIYYPGDAYMKGENNSGIICSRDEIYRFRGHTKSGAVYIYAGRKESSKGENSSFDDYTNPSLIKAPQPNNVISDSAYIYISQKADVDSLYKYKIARGTYSKAISPHLAKGERETRKGISLASIKADDIVLMSRVSGIRLITGTDNKNSKDGDQYSKFGIDLIAGNNDADLQPLVKGDNLVRYLTDLSKTVDDLRSVVYDFMNSQSKLNNQVAMHTHYDPFLMTMGSIGPQNPLAIDVASIFGAPAGGGKCPPSTELQSAGATSLLETIRQQANTINLILNQVGNDTNAFNAIGSYNILSDKNRTN